MEIRAKAKFIRMSPRKVRLVADVVRGLDAEDALVKLDFLPKLATKPIEKLLKSAITSAKHNHDIDLDNLKIKEITVDEGPKIKRWTPRAHGRATMILKRVSHIIMVLEEKVPGKGKKKKVEKKTGKKGEEKVEGKVPRLRPADSARDDKVRDDKEEAKPTDFVEKPKPKTPQEQIKKTEDKKFLKKVFRRKSGM